MTLSTQVELVIVLLDYVSPDIRQRKLTTIVLNYFGNSDRNGSCQTQATLQEKCCYWLSNQAWVEDGWHVTRFWHRALPQRIKYDL